MESKSIDCPVKLAEQVFTVTFLQYIEEMNKRGYDNDFIETKLTTLMSEVSKGEIKLSR